VRASQARRVWRAASCNFDRRSLVDAFRAYRGDAIVVVPILFVDRFLLAELPAGKITVLTGDNRQGSPVTISSDALDPQIIRQYPAQAVGRGIRIARRAIAACAAVSGKFRCIDAQQPDMLTCAIQRIAIDGPAFAD